MSQSPGMSHREHEAAILGTLRRELGETKYDRWLGNASASVQAGESGQDPHSVVIEVDNAFAARWVETKFIPELRVACKGIRSEQTPPWRIRVRQDDTVKSTDASTPAGDANGFSGPRSAETPSASQPASPSSHSAWKPSRGPATNQPTHRGQAGPMAAYRQLEHFVEGPSNQLAYRSVCRLLEDPQHASPMSPLFLHGDCGVGKTHLLQARRAGGFHPIQSHPVLLRGAIHERIHSCRPRTRLGALPTTTANSGPFGHR